MKKSLLATTFIAFPLAAKTTRLRTYGCVAIVFLAGCAVLDTHQAKLDQKQLRDVLMDYTEDQILDNLIRAYNGRPIVHFDFARINAAVTSKFTPTVGGGRTGMDVNTRTPTRTTKITDSNTQNTGAMVGTTVVHAVESTVSVVGGVVQTVTRPFTYNVSAERDNVISLDVKPVLDDRSVYAAYVSFLNCQTPGGSCNVPKEENKPTKITTTEETPTTITKTIDYTDAKAPPPPPPKQTTETATKEKSSTATEEVPKKILNLSVDFRHIKSLRCDAPSASERVLVGKVWNNRYYWVPENYKRAFFALCLATVARAPAAPSAAAAEIKEELQDLRSLEQQDFLSR